MEEVDKVRRRRRVFRRRTTIVVNNLNQELVEKDEIPEAELRTEPR